MYITRSEKMMFQKVEWKQPNNNEAIEKVIYVNDDKQYQTIDGFGASFTDSSAFLVNKILSDEDKELAMRQLFSEDGIGLSLLRNPMGASDFARFIYSYNDLPKGKTDFELNRFSIRHDLEDIMPLTKQAIKLNPKLKVMASPWSAPGWMKTTDSMIGGELKEECYEVYGDYFVRFIQEYEKHDVPIYAVTPQNEPLYVPPHYPGMLMDAKMQSKFIATSLGPKLKDANIKTKILAYDHNWDREDYPIDVLNSDANQFVDGVAWHVYGGNPKAQSSVKEMFPDKEVHFTEASGGEWVPPFDKAFYGTIETIIDVLRNYSKSVILWNIALDEYNAPVVWESGVTTCRGLLLVDQATRKLTFNLDFYALAHFSKFTEPGAVRIDSSQYEEIKTVALKNIDGSILLVLYNKNWKKEQNIQVTYKDKSFTLNIPEKSVVSIVI